MDVTGYCWLLEVDDVDRAVIQSLVCWHDEKVLCQMKMNATNHCRHKLPYVSGPQCHNLAGYRDTDCVAIVDSFMEHATLGARCDRDK